METIPMTETFHRSGIAAGNGIVAVSVITEWFASHSLQDITVWCAVGGLLLNAFTSIPKIVESCRVLVGLVRPTPVANAKGKPQ
jgi:hypothetical protein